MTLVVDFNSDASTLGLVPTAVASQGDTLPPAVTQLDALTIGTDVLHHVPLELLTGPHWDGAQTLPQRVQLYAFPTHPVAARDVWLPPGFTPADCGRMVPLAPGDLTLTGMALQLDGHPVTGVLEMMPYGSETNRDEKMNVVAFHTLGLSEQSSRLQDGRVTRVHLTIGHNNFWTGSVKVFPHLEVEDGLAPQTPVMLLNLTTIRDLVLFNSTSGGLVCLRTP